MIEAKGKHLTIKELFAEMKTLYARLIKLAEVYNRSLNGIKITNYKEVMVKGGKRGNGVYDNVDKKIDSKNEFDVVKASFLSYEKELEDKLREMIVTKPTEYCIVFLRDELHWKWEEISKLVNYSIRQCIRLYKKEKNSDVTQCHTMSH